ncbi:PspC domain-containing protein [Corynebacterium sp.]|uniref:ATP-binding protein n=1 Tax=Corynebacterium sp. TaxID=1720 RepID=UPI0026DB7059|nr:PspC domain-containing protein [Corynebacterium sp.]MDO5077105.1 PspC domain-containing protein [Corynebacterium sp.]
MDSPYPTYVRYRQGRVVAGVAAGLSGHLGVNVFMVRLAMIFTMLFGGIGLLFYSLLWISTKLQDAPPEVLEQQQRQVGSFMLVPVGLLGAVASFSFATGFQGSTLLALGSLGMGAMLAWRAMDSGEDAFTSSRGILSILAGALLLGSGVVLALLNWETPAVFMASIVAVLLTLAGVLVLGLPLWLRLWDALTEARAETRAAAERAEIASRLHDSVLQTLALIQKQVDDPQAVARLARSQERQLRQWLFESEKTQPTTTFAALGRACAEVEDMFGLHIAPVTVGADSPLTVETQAAVLAAREAMVNAAKYAQVAQLDVYAENFDGLEIFVRDRGVGFDVDCIPADRHGVRDSILGRMKRVGGEAEIRSGDDGTEVKIRVSVGETAVGEDLLHFPPPVSESQSEGTQVP